MLTLRSLGNTLSSIILFAFPAVYGIGAGKIADDLGKAAFRPAWGSLMTRVSNIDQRRRAEAMSWMTMGEDAGTILGPVIAGVMWSTWGIGLVLGFRIALALGTEIYTIRLTRIASIVSSNAGTARQSEDGQRRLPTPNLRVAKVMNGYPCVLPSAGSKGISYTKTRRTGRRTMPRPGRKSGLKHADKSLTWSRGSEQAVRSPARGVDSKSAIPRFNRLRYNRTSSGATRHRID